MVRETNRLTAAQEILMGAGDLDRGGKSEFSEWDLTVSTWKRNPNRFGARGYEDQYPDHKRVMMEIMGITKKDNPLRRGWFERTRPNYYRITDIGRSEVENISATKSPTERSHRSPQSIYDAIAPLYHQAIFRKHIKDTEEPRMWVGAASFLGLTSNDALHVEDRRRATRTAIDNALTWLDETDNKSLRRGVTGGSEAIGRTDLLKLREFLDLIEKRFVNQLEAIRKTRK